MLVMIALGRLPDARAVACRACAVRIASRTTREIGRPTCRSRAAMRASSGARRTFRSFTSVIVKTPCLYVKHRAPTAAFAGAPRWCACRYPSASAHGQEADKLVGPRSSAAGGGPCSPARATVSALKWRARRDLNPRPLDCRGWSVLRQAEDTRAGRAGLTDAAPVQRREPVIVTDAPADIVRFASYTVRP